MNDGIVTVKKPKMIFVLIGVDNTSNCSDKTAERGHRIKHGLRSRSTAPVLRLSLCATTEHTM